MAKLNIEDIKQGAFKQGDKMLGSGHAPGYLKGKPLSEAGRGLCDYLAWLNDNTGYTWSIELRIGSHSSSISLVRTKDGQSEYYAVDIEANPTDTANSSIALEKIAVKMVKNSILKEAPNEII